MLGLDLRGVGPGTLLRRTISDFIDDDMPTYASALAYSSLFSLFPFMLFLLSLLGFLHLPQFFDWLREQMALVLPAQALEQVNPILDQLRERQGGLLSFGIIAALWSASAGVRSMMNAMNIAYDVEEGRPFWKKYALSVLYTAGIAAMVIAAAALMVTGPQVMGWLAQQVGLQEVVITIWTWARWPVAVVLMMLAVAVTYWATPDVEQRFRFVSPGSVLAVIVWIAASLAFGWYVSHFANYNATYGSIGAVIVLLLYFYLTSAVLLFGAEMNAVIEHSAANGKAPGEKKLDGDGESAPTATRGPRTGHPASSAGAR